MCGICGVAFADPGRPVDRYLIELMSGTIAHRGPDDDGVFIDGPVGLGHRRLSIVDLSGGHQPMQNEDGGVTLVFNGEVYNHAEHRDGLVARGHVLRTRSDTEAIVHLYEERGAAVPESLGGMFAFAIWDAKRRSLLLARDRVGIKPLFYSLTADGDLVFASEIKAILASGLVEPRLDEERLAEFFALGASTDGGSLFKGIRELEPGSTLEWRDGAVVARRYWTPPSPAGQSAPRPDDASRRFWSLFTEAVNSTLMSDVPLGVFLSGGLDSSLIVAAMRARGVDALRTFSVGFAEAEASELPFARIVAEHYRTEHHEVICTAHQFFDALPLLTRHRDHPLVFSASIPLFLVAQLARNHVKVVLTGEGSDELFAGYGRYPRGLLNWRTATALDSLLPAVARRALRGAVSRAGDGYLGSRAKRSFLVQEGQFESAYLEAFADFDAEHRSRLLHPELNGNAYARVPAVLEADTLRTNPLEAMLRFDQRTYLSELLSKQDQMSMAASIESRVPFLEPPLLDWAASLSPRAKLRGSIGKLPVRKAARRHLPPTITEARKRGFLVPLQRWLRERARGLVAEYGPSRDDAYLQAPYVGELVRQHEQGIDHTARLWRIIAFQVWRREVLEASRSAVVTHTAGRA